MFTHGKLDSSLLISSSSTTFHYLSLSHLPLQYSPLLLLLLLLLYLLILPNLSPLIPPSQSQSLPMPLLPFLFLLLFRFCFVFHCIIIILISSMMISAKAQWNESSVSSMMILPEVQSYLYYYQIII